MVQINQAMLNPSSIGSINYSPATTATAVGLQAVNQAKSQKNARIRQSLKEAEANRNLSNQAQASWTAAVNENPELGATIELAPEAVKKAFKKVQSGNGGVADNTLIAGYFGAVDAEAKQAAARSNAIRLNQLDLATKEAQVVSAQAKAFVDQVGATPEAIIAQTQADMALKQAQTDQAQAEAALARSKIQDGRSKLAMINAIANPQAAMNTPPKGVASVLPENIPTSAPAPTSTPAPAPAPETLSEVETIRLLEETPLSPTTVTDTKTGKQFLQSADGTQRAAVPQIKDPSGKIVSDSSNQIAVTPQIVNKVAVESGEDTATVEQTLSAINDYEKQKDDFVNRGIDTNKATLSQRIAQLVDAGVDFKEARQTAEEELKSGILQQGLSNEEKQKREDKFVQSFENTQSGLRNALSLNAQLTGISDQLKDNIGYATTKLLGAIQRGARVDFNLSWLGFENKDPREVQQKLQRLVADATLGKIDQMKKLASEMGGSGTGLGQVSIVEIDLLKNAQSSLADNQSAPVLKQNIDQYMYYKNTSAYSLYQQAVSKYGEALALSMMGGNKDQLNRIAERIEYYETNTDFGKQLVAQNGSYADRSKAPLSKNIRSNNPLPQTSTLPINPSNIGM